MMPCPKHVLAVTCFWNDFPFQPPTIFFKYNQPIFKHNQSIFKHNQKIFKYNQPILKHNQLLSLSTTNQSSLCWYF